MRFATDYGYQLVKCLEGTLWECSFDEIEACYRMDIVVEMEVKN